MKAKTVTLGVRVEAAVKTKLKAAAKAEQRTLSGYVAKVLTDCVRGK